MDRPTLEVMLRQDSPIPLNVQFSCWQGRTMALIGPSGAGKTTILRSIAGLYRPASAHITCNGEVWLDTAAGYERAPHERRTGLVFQSYAL
ncbi:MAG: ATP-binding cassette domain-containing protein, partial [Gemmatimonas sp.]